MNCSIPVSFSTDPRIGRVNGLPGHLDYRSILRCRCVRRGFDLCCDSQSRVGFGKLGMDVALMRFITGFATRQQFDSIKGVYVTAMRHVVPISLGIAVLLWLLARADGRPTVSQTGSCSCPSDQRMVHPSARSLAVAFGGGAWVEAHRILYLFPNRRGIHCCDAAVVSDDDGRYRPIRPCVYSSYASRWSAWHPA